MAFLTGKVPFPFCQSFGRFVRLLVMSILQKKADSIELPFENQFTGPKVTGPKIRRSFVQRVAGPKFTVPKGHWSEISFLNGVFVNVVSTFISLDIHQLLHYCTAAVIIYSSSTPVHNEAVSPPHRILKYDSALMDPGGFVGGVCGTLHPHNMPMETDAINYLSDSHHYCAIMAWMVVQPVV